MKYFIKVLTFFFSLLLILPSLHFFYSRFCYDLKFPIVYDAFALAMVGRGFSNGFLPYADIFEVKPIGIFILHFISYKLTDTLLLSHLFHIFCYALLFLMPLLFIKFVIIKNKSIIQYSLAIGISSILITYVDLKGGRLFPELFGVFFSCLYVIVINTDFYKKHEKISYMISGLLICIACNFKEPFLLTILSTSIIFSQNLKVFSKKFVIPFLIACILSTTFLISLHLLLPFFEYLHYMVFVHSIADNQTIFKRAFFDINNIFMTLNDFDYFLGYVFLLLLIFPIFNTLYGKIFIINKIKYASLLSMKLLLALYIATMAVRSSGMYYYQHNCFALPFIFALLIYFLKTVNLKKMPIICYSLIIYLCLITSLYYYPTNKILNSSDDFFYDSQLKAEANYVDAILDKIDEKTYVYIGGLGFHLWGYTKHSPKGKYAVQVSNWNAEKLPKFYESIIDNVSDAKLIIFNNYKDEKLKNKIEPILNKNFTTKTPYSLKNIPMPKMRYKIYFRKNLN